MYLLTRDSQRIYLSLRYSSSNTQSCAARLVAPLAEMDFLVTCTSEWQHKSRMSTSYLGAEKAQGPNVRSGSSIDRDASRESRLWSEDVSVSLVQVHLQLLFLERCISWIF